MAAMYAKSAGGNWSAAGTWSATSAAGVDSVGPPTAATDVIFELASGNVTVDSGAVCRSLNTTSGVGTYGGTLTHNSGVTLTIGDATAGAGNVAIKLNSGMTYTKNSSTTSAISFISSSTTTQTITSGGKTFGNTTINHANIKLQLTDAMNVSGAWTVTACNTFDMNGQTLTVGTSNLTFASGGKTYSGLVTINSTGTGLMVINGSPTFSGGLTVQDLTGIQGSWFRLDSGITVSGGNLTLAGFAANNRLMVGTNTVGSSATITNAGSTQVWSNVDFRDITLGTSYDASAITGKCGDAGGNSGITFTTGVTQYYQTAVSANWSNTAKWFLGSNGTGGAGRVPLPQDDAVFDANSVTAASKTISIDVPIFCKSLDFTGVANSPTIAITYGGSRTNFMMGSLTLVAGMTWPSSSFDFQARSGSLTITHAGKTVNWSLRAPGATYTMQDACTQTQGGNTPLLLGTLTTNGYNLTLLQLFMGNTASAILNAGASTISLSATSGNPLSVQGSSVVNMGTSTVHFTDTGASSKTFAGSGKTYYIFKITTGGAGTIDITGSNTFNSITYTGGTTKTVRFTAGTTTTLTGGASALGGGAASNLITYKSVTDSSAWTISSATTLSTDYISLRDSTGAGVGKSHYAGANSTNVSGNTFWNFTAPPSTNTSNFFFMFA